jgi:hypothetical protein
VASLTSLIGNTDDRFSQLPAVGVPDDAASVGEDVAVWDSFPLVRPPQVLNRHTGLRTLSELCVVLHQHIDLRSKVNKADENDKADFVEDAKGIFGNLLDWADSIPSTMTRSPECLPLVIDMQ